MSQDSDMGNLKLEDVSPGFYNLAHGDKGYDLSHSQSRMQAPYDLLKSMTDNEDARHAGRTSPHAEQAVGALGTSPKKSKKKKPAVSKSKKKGGKRKSRRRTRRKNGCGKKKFKKHYMWNKRGKRYVAKTYKQHKRGVKLGHTHKKPKKKSRKRRR